MLAPQIITILAGMAIGVPAANATVGPAELTRRTGSIYKIRDITGPNITGKFHAGYADLGIPALTPDDRYIFVCGNTFEDKVGGPDWRAPTAFYSTSTDLFKLDIDQCVGGKTARALVPDDHHGGTTAIPSDVFQANGKLYLNLMRGVIFKPTHPEFWVSEDNGEHSTYLYDWPASLYNRAFQQKNCGTGDDGYVYCISTVFNRANVSDILLHRVPVNRLEYKSAWEPYGQSNGSWDWGNYPTTIMRPREWGEISIANLGNNQWVMTWLNMQPLGIRYMVIHSPNDNLFRAYEGMLIQPVATLEEQEGNKVASPYGPFIFPGSSLDSFFFTVSQWTGETYRVMEYHADGLF